MSLATSNCPRRCKHIPGMTSTTVWTPFTTTNWKWRRIYVVQCASCSLVKIGQSTDVQTRLTCLRREFESDMLLLASFYSIAGREQFLHRRFRSQLAYSREWFYPSADILDMANRIGVIPENKRLRGKAGEALRSPPPVGGGVKALPSRVRYCRDVAEATYAELSAMSGLAVSGLAHVSSSRSALALSLVVGDSEWLQTGNGKPPSPSVIRRSVAAARMRQR